MALAWTGALSRLPLEAAGAAEKPSIQRGALPAASSWSAGLSTGPGVTARPWRWHEWQGATYRCTAQSLLVWCKPRRRRPGAGGPGRGWSPAGGGGGGPGDSDSPQSLRFQVGSGSQLEAGI